MGVWEEFEKAKQGLEARRDELVARRAKFVDAIDAEIDRIDDAIAPQPEVYTEIVRVAPDLATLQMLDYCSKNPDAIEKAKWANPEPAPRTMTELLVAFLDVNPGKTESEIDAALGAPYASVISNLVRKGGLRADGKKPNYRYFLQAESIGVHS